MSASPPEAWPTPAADPVGPPLGLSIGPLTNLQDARAAAAWGADYLSFSLERGSLHKLPEATLASILEWIAGPLPVISLGHDVEQVYSLAERDWGGTWAAELAASAFPSGPSAHELPDLPLVWTLTPADVVRAPDARIHAFRQALYLELVVPPSLGPGIDAVISQLVATCGRTPLYLRADGLPPELIERALPRIQGLSLGPTLADDFAQLDYDAVEALIARYRP